MPLEELKLELWYKKILQYRGTNYMNHMLQFILIPNSISKKTNNKRETKDWEIYW